MCSIQSLLHRKKLSNPHHDPSFKWNYSYKIWKRKVEKKPHRSIINLAGNTKEPCDYSWGLYFMQMKNGNKPAELYQKPSESAHCNVEEHPGFTFAPKQFQSEIVYPLLYIWKMAAQIASIRSINVILCQKLVLLSKLYCNNIWIARSYDKETFVLQKLSVYFQIHTVFLGRCAHDALYLTVES